MDTGWKKNGTSCWRIGAPKAAKCLNPKVYRITIILKHYDFTIFLPLAFDTTEITLILCAISSIAVTAGAIFVVF